MVKKSHTKTGVDRISDLPEPIKVHILSFLNITEAVRASILSSSWRALSPWLPNLDCSSCFTYMKCNILENPQRINTIRGYEADDADFRRESMRRLKLRQSFYTFIDQALRSTAELEMLKLFVPADSGSEFKSCLDCWLHGAVSRCVKELELKFRVRQDPRYNLPERVLVANSIRKLELEHCVLSVPSLNGIRLPLLQKLCLRDVYLDEMALGSVFANCLNLVHCSLSECHGLTVMNISGHKLWEVRVELFSKEVQVFKMMAPNLLNFSYYGGFNDNSRHFELDGCNKMKHLYMEGSELDDKGLVVILENLPLLETLSLTKCYRLQYAEIFCKHLVQLEIFNCRNLIRANIGLPNLKVFKYEGYDPLSLVSNGLALNLTDANLFLNSSDGDDKWFDGLINLLAKLNQSETLTLDVDYIEDTIIPETKRTKTHPPLYAVKNFWVSLRMSRLESSVDIVESLLWLAPCPEHITISENDYITLLSIKDLKSRTAITIQKIWPELADSMREMWIFPGTFMYEKPAIGNKKCGCWKGPINCWRHSLEKLWIETRESAEAASKLVEFFKKEKIGGKIECFIKHLKPKRGDEVFLW